MVKRIVGWPYRYGGVEHSGWLAPGAATPLPTPVHDVLVDLEIQGDDVAGYLLIFTAQDGSFCNDNWYQSLAEAEKDAEEEFGAPVDQWQTI